jgi:hypothetical protein
VVHAVQTLLIVVTGVVGAMKLHDA